MTLKLAAAALAAAVASPALAQTPPTSQAPQMVTRAQLTQQVDGEFKRLDANGDGKISKAEIQAALDKMMSNTAAELKKRQDEEFSKLDKDKNGQLSLAEYESGVKVTPKAGAADQRLQAFDANKDGVITPAEFRAKPLAEFDSLDTNKDGVVSEAEMKAASSKATASRR